jgi:hypothetical protein
MTLPTELAKGNQSLEYFITIEGVGWPSDWADLTSGFDGTVWTTSDINSDLASTLGCTVKFGLDLPDTISDEIDPKTCEYKIGGLDFTINDSDDWWAENFTPRETASYNTAIFDDAAGLRWYDTDVKLTQGTPNEGDLIWVAGRECIKLGVEALIGGGPETSYTGSTRGYLGTQRGSSLRRLANNAEGFFHGFWPVGTPVSDVSRYWWNRKVALWAHVPGEAVGLCQLLWFGKLRSINSSVLGVDFDFSCSGDFLNILSRTVSPKAWKISQDTSPQVGTDLVADLGSTLHTNNERLSINTRRLLFDGPVHEGEEYGGEDQGNYALMAAYRYRSEPGNLNDAIATWHTGTVQAHSDATGKRLDSFVLLDDKDIIFMIREDPTPTNPKLVIAENISRVGTTELGTVPNQLAGGAQEIAIGQSFNYDNGTKAKFLLHNHCDNAISNRFRLGRYANTRVSRNPINLLLFFMCSMDDCLWNGDNVAGGTTSAIKFAATNVANDFWIGRALFAMEGNDKWEVRTITDNDATDITVARAFTGPYAAAKEYQVRNSQYDVLPLGWGMGIDAKYIDIDAFEQLRDSYFSDAHVAPFVIGMEDEINIWNFLKENICKPYGILLYFDRDTRKIKPRYITHAPGLDDIDGYATLAGSDIVELGNINHHFSNPVGKVILEVRSKTKKIVGASVAPGQTYSNSYYAPITEVVAEPIGGEVDRIILRTKEVDCAFSDSELDSVTVKAHLDTLDTLNSLVEHLLGMLGAYVNPPPVWDPGVMVSKWSDLTPGRIVSITWADAPIDPFDGGRGWSGLVGRVLKTSLPLSGDSLVCSVTMELHSPLERSLLAPAAIMNGVANDGGLGVLQVNDNDLATDPENNVDWYGFAVGDTVEWRDATGAVIESHTIDSFGANHAATPEAANSSVINTTANVVAAFTADDYVTFQPWGSATTRMEDYSAYASSTGLLGGVDAAKVFT